MSTEKCCYLNQSYSITAGHRGITYGERKPLFPVLLPGSNQKICTKFLYPTMDLVEELQRVQRQGEEKLESTNQPPCLSKSKVHSDNIIHVSFSHS